MSEAQHETRDVNLRAFWRLGIAFVVSGVLLQLAVWMVFGFLSRREAARTAPPSSLIVQQESRLPPEPRLQSNPHVDLARFRAQEDGILTSYGWVDRNSGVVRIPIEQAMKLIVERGLPSQEGDNAPR